MGETVVLKNDAVRFPFKTFGPSIWADTFTSFSSGDVQVQERYAEEMEALKEQIREMLIAAGNSTLHHRLTLIDLLERLGIAHHFKQDIEEQIQQISNFPAEDLDHLFTIALRFRILRQHHHHASSGIFEKFKSEDGKFKEMLCGDVEGLLSLYEASYVRTHGEDILEDGLAFTTHHLNLIAPKLECPLQDRVRRALQHPLQRGLSKIESRHFISFYEKDNSHNKVLLKLAKLDFNYMQNLYKKELHEICKWWDKFDLKSKLPYARDRVPEAYFWSAALHSEAEDSFPRLTLAKWILVTSVFDDTYDNYATIEEAKVFTEVVKRWDIKKIDRLPDYMKVVYNFTLSTYGELIRETSERGISSAAPNVREEMKELALAYYDELKWFLGIEIPTFEAHHANLVVTGNVFVLAVPAMLGLKSASDQAFDWIRSRANKLVLASTLIARYRDDLASHEREDRGGNMLTAITMYMKQHGVTKQETLNRFAEMIEDAWKDISAEWLNLPPNIPRDAATLLVNFARTAELVYCSSEDGYTSAEKGLAPEIAGLFVDPLII